MLLKIAILTILGQASNLLLRQSSQKNIATNGAIVWQGWGWFIRKNGRAVLGWFVAYGSLYLLLSRFLQATVISNYADLWTFGPFQIQAGVIYEVLIGFAAWGFGAAGSDYVMRWVGGSAKIVISEIGKKTTNDPKQFTTLPDEPTPPTQ